MMFSSDLKATFSDIFGISLPLLEADIKFLISPWLMLFTEVELASKVDSDSLTLIASSISMSESSHASSSTRKSLRKSHKLAVVNVLPFWERGRTGLHLLILVLLNLLPLLV